MQLEILKVEEKEVMIKGEPQKIKKCMIEVEGRQYPYKNVTVWNNYPEYAGVQAGAKFTHSHIVTTEQEGTLNPHNNKPYNNYTLTYGEGSGQASTGGSDNSVQLTRMEAKIDQLMSKAGIVAQKAVSEPTDSIDPDDIPF